MILDRKVMGSNYSSTAEQPNELRSVHNQIFRCLEPVAEYGSTFGSERQISSARGCM